MTHGPSAGDAQTTDAPMTRALATQPGWHAHDLLRVARIPMHGTPPDWLRVAFARAPFVVVRRARAMPGRIPAGVRGTARAERLGLHVDVRDVQTRYAPEHLVAMRPAPERAAWPAFAALAVLRDACPLPLCALTWGPTGSAGFELATGVPAVTPGSDLDLLIRMPQRCGSDAARALLEMLTRVGERAHARIDAQLETPAGGVALAELAASKPRVLARGIDGPALCADPWAAP